MDRTNQGTKAIINIVSTRLKKMGYSFNDIDEKQQNYLIKLELCISEIFKIEKEVKAILSKNNISIKNVSETTKISRQTFYNIPILNEYVTYCAKEFEKIDISSLQTNMSEELQRLKEDVKEMHKRDVQIELLKNDIKKLKQSLKLKEEKIVTQSKKIYEMLENNTMIN